MTKRVKISLIVLFALKVTISSAQVEYCPLVTQVYHINLSGNNPPGYVGDYFETPCGNFNVGGYHYKDGNYPAPATFSLYDIFSSFWVIGSAPFLEMFTPSGEFAQTIVPPIVYLEGNVVSSNIYPPPIYGSIELLWYNGYSTWSFNNYEGVAYLGFFRIMPDGLHYGWIRFISSNLNGFSFQLLGLAWETRPNVPIVCGDEGYDCPAFDTPPVGLTKSFNPVAGVQDRVQLKWFKEEAQVKYSDADAAACDIKVWAKRNLDPITGDPIGNVIQNPDTILLENVLKTYPDGSPREIFKWPLKYRANGVDNSRRVDPNIRYEWQVRCACAHGLGFESPWSEVKTFNTPNFDPETGQNTTMQNFSDLKGLTEPSALQVFPNPNNGKNLSVQYDDLIITGDTRIEVYNSQGNLVESMQGLNTQGLPSIALDNELSSGFYILRVLDENGQHTCTFQVVN